MASRNKIFVGGLSQSTNTESLREYFEKYGDIHDTVVIKDQTTGLNRGFGFVTFTSHASTVNALRDEHIIHGKKVEAKIAISKHEILNQSRIYVVHHDGIYTADNTQICYNCGLPTVSMFGNCYGPLFPGKMSSSLHYYSSTNGCFIVKSVEDYNKSLNFGGVITQP